MCINGRAGDIQNRWMDLSGIRVRGRDTVGGPESLIWLLCSDPKSMQHCTTGTEFCQRGVQRSW
jgi:hypothetical protein